MFDHSPALAADAYMAELSQLGLAPATESERAVMGKPFDALVVDPAQLAEAGLGGLRNGDVVKATRVGPGWWRLSWSGASIWTSVEEADATAARTDSSQESRPGDRLGDDENPIPGPGGQTLPRSPTARLWSPPPAKPNPADRPRPPLPEGRPPIRPVSTTTSTTPTTTTTTSTQPPADRSGPPTTMGKIVVSSAAIVRPVDQGKTGFKEEDLMTGDVRGRVGRNQPDRSGDQRRRGKNSGH